MDAFLPPAQGTCSEFLAMGFGPCLDLAMEGEMYICNENWPVRSMLVYVLTYPEKERDN